VRFEALKEYDIIIVGGGPGGSSAAKLAAEKGLKTIFFERGRKPGEKNSSGCGLGPRLWREFDFMKELSPEICPSMRQTTYAKNAFINKDDQLVGMVMARPTESVTYEPAKSFITMNIYRSEFDPWVADFAIRAGAELKTSTLVKGLLKEKGKVVGVIDEKGEKYKSPIIIGADGVVSMVAKEAGLRAKWGPLEVTLVPQYDFKCDRKKLDDLIRDEAVTIWWGVNFPAAYQVFFGDGFHIGLGNWMNWWDKNPLYYLNRVIGLDYFQKWIKLLDAKPREVQAHLLPWTGYPHDTYTDNVMLIGDAGGFPCPLEAEGIYPAMLTGKLAAEVAVKAISDGDTSKSALKAYEGAWQKSSVGVEFESGPELSNIWRELPFKPQETMSWFIPLYMELMGGIYDWSEPHVIRVRQIIEKIQSYLPTAIPFIMKHVMPLLAEIMGEDLQQLGLLPNMLKKLLPKPKKRRGKDE
jgi:flavin-dependent dehydrogenase